MNAQHWRSEQLYGQRDVFRFIAAAACYALIIYPDKTIQFLAGVAFVFALYCQFRAGAVAREIDEAAANLVLETDPVRNAEARDRLDSLVIRSRWHDRL
ncbi:MAG TPA: hypothetical protein VNO53_02930 [Steroidobacteraceae bacterium]|nr:hypothetical protein [Steroidobacteraceae bacterium]